MEAIPTPTPTPATAPVTTPAFAVPPTPVAPAPAMPNVQMADGGVTSDSGSSNNNGVKDFFRGVNWTEVIFGALGVGALVYVIYYYRFKIQQDKLINNELQRQIDELKMNLQSNMGAKYKPM